MAAVFFVWAPAFVLALLYLLSVIGLVLSPFAAIGMFRMAGDRGLDPTRYAILAALCSVLFVLPWLYMVAIVRGRRFPIGRVLITFYIVWLIGPIYNSFFILGTSAGGTWLGMAGIIMGLAWVISLLWMVVSDPYDRSLRCALLPLKHIVPFACMFVSVWSMRMLGFLVDPPCSELDTALGGCIP